MKNCHQMRTSSMIDEANTQAGCSTYAKWRAHSKFMGGLHWTRTIETRLVTNGGRKREGLVGVRTNWFCTPLMSFIQVGKRENWGERKKGRLVGAERGVLEAGKVNNGFSAENNLSCYWWCFGLRKSNSTKINTKWS